MPAKLTFEAVVYRFHVLLTVCAVDLGETVLDGSQANRIPAMEALVACKVACKVAMATD